jgi:hypothetical protein
MKEMNIFERSVGGRRYRVASQSIWDPVKQLPVARQVVLGPADPPPVADLGSVRKVGGRRIGDVGALVWVAEQLDLVRLIDQACEVTTPIEGPTVGEMVLAVAVQRACSPSAKRHLPTFLESCLPVVSCLPASAFTGREFHRWASRIHDRHLEQAQIEIARATVRRFALSTDVLAFDTTNFDTHIATTTTGELARRGHAKSKRSDLRVVGLATLVSETGHVPLLHRTYPGNGSDQAVLRDCLGALGKLHEALDDAEQPQRPACRTLVRDGGSWSEQLELDLDGEGYYSLISLPLSHGASELALEHAAQRGAMKPLGGALADVRAARLRAPVGELDRTLVVVESQELLRGQKRGISVALRKAKEALGKLERRAARGRIQREALEEHVRKVLQPEHLSEFVVATVSERAGQLTLDWRVDARRRRLMHRPSYLEHGENRARLPGTVECGGVIPASEERWSGALGAFASVGRRFATIAHLRHGDRADVGEFGSRGVGRQKLGAQHDANTGGNRSHPGTGFNGSARATRECANTARAHR